MFLDTSIIIELFTSEGSAEIVEEIFAHIETEPAYISLIQLGEISDWCLRNDIQPLETITALKEVMEIVPLSEDIILNGSRIKFERRREGQRNFSLIDGIILASARTINQHLLTLDSDFQELGDVLLLSLD